MSRLGRASDRRGPPGVARALSRLPGVYARLAWWGIVAPRLREVSPLLVVQAVVISPRGILLTVRSDLRGWELPGGNPEPDEPEEQALRREVREETGLAVAVEGLVGEYVRTGFRPHRARVYRCRAVGGTLRGSRETPRAAWFSPERLPRTLFPWYRAPVADALAGGPEPRRRREHNGPRAVAAGLAIDLRMRLSGDRAT